ncbi:MAG: hypothetical protein AAGJ83_14600, partial [Planctomycetota bacterium]
KKMVAQDDGSESEIEMDDEVEIGAFAKPAQGSKYGRVLYRERIRLTTGKHQHTFVIDEVPHEVGVDPFALLIDRVVGDNVKRATERR